MAKNGKDTKNTRHITSTMNFVRNGEYYNLQKNMAWGGLKLESIGTKNVREDDLNPILGYTMVSLENLHITCTRWVIWFKRVWITRYSGESTGLILYGLDLMGLKYWIQHWKLFWKPYEKYLKTVSRKPWINRDKIKR